LNDATADAGGLWLAAPEAGAGAALRSICRYEWARRKNHGATVAVDAPSVKETALVLGGAYDGDIEIALMLDAIGAGEDDSAPQTQEAS